jgi:hypothetical protein
MGSSPGRRPRYRLPFALADPIQKLRSDKGCPEGLILRDDSYTW